MTVDDWIAAFQGMVDQLEAISTNLAGINTGISGSLSDISTSLNSIATTLTDFNTLGVTALTMIFLFVFVWLAYWRRNTELYVFAGFLSLLLGLRWIGDSTWFIFGIFCFGLGLTTFYRAIMSARGR